MQVQGIPGVRHLQKGILLLPILVPHTRATLIGSPKLSHVQFGVGMCILQDRLQLGRARGRDRGSQIVTLTEQGIGGIPVMIPIHFAFELAKLLSLMPQALVHHRPALRTNHVPGPGIGNEGLLVPTRRTLKVLDWRRWRDRVHDFLFFLLATLSQYDCLVDAAANALKLGFGEIRSEQLADSVGSRESNVVFDAGLDVAVDVGGVFGDEFLEVGECELGEVVAEGALGVGEGGKEDLLIASVENGLKEHHQGCLIVDFPQ